MSVKQWTFAFKIAVPIRFVERFKYDVNTLFVKSWHQSVRITTKRLVVRHFDRLKIDIDIVVLEHGIADRVKSTLLV